jgi:DNA repair protein RadA/Sms
MAKPQKRFCCQACGAVTLQWAGRCESCGDWNTITEDIPAPGPALTKNASLLSSRLEVTGLTGEAEPPPRVKSGIEELDRVLGGGFVPGSAVLIGGDPGIGKSTLLLQAASRMAASGSSVLYVSGEEAVAQIRMRASRLDLAQSPLDLAASIDMGAIIATLGQKPARAMVVIDSIQTMWMEAIESAPGTVTQVRAAAFALIRAAKLHGFALVLVGHVTKDGSIAGPRVLEHMVDAVLHFEGDRGHQFRILRGLKNRFGATDEIGVFEMTGAGLAEVANPSALFLAERRGNIAGSAVFAGIEGTRPVLLEIQALLSASGAAAPRRAVIGWDSGRLAMLLAVLEARAGLKLGTGDVYLNVAGGLRVTEPAADLTVAAALISAASGVATPPGAAFFGEIGLSGEVRQVPQSEPRLKEALKLGFDRVFMPRRVARGSKSPLPKGLQLTEIGHVSELAAALGVTNIS